MDLKFVSPELRNLDQLHSEVIVLPLFDDERPAQGAFSLVDYRLCGHLSAMRKAGELSGRLLLAQAVPGRPKLQCEKVVIVGAGLLAEYNEQIHARVVLRMLESVDQLGARRATAELPGRAQGRIGPELAVEALLAAAREFPRQDTWTLLEHPAAARVMAALAPADPSRRWTRPRPSSP
jgi:Cytosol aminopeptidase family, N-terminal domain